MIFDYFSYYMLIRLSELLAQAPLTIITKHSILDVAAALDPPLRLLRACGLGHISFMRLERTSNQ